MKFLKMFLLVVFFSGFISAGTTAAWAQSSAALSRDGTQVLIQKDVGEERWSITLRLRDGYALGNVFSPNGVTFLGCDLIDQRAGELSHSCWGFEPGVVSIDSGDWLPLATVTLPESFWFPVGLGISAPDFFRPRPYGSAVQAFIEVPPSLLQ